jgi:hypothetical protein
MKARPLQVVPMNVLETPTRFFRALLNPSRYQPTTHQLLFIARSLALHGHWNRNVRQTLKRLIAMLVLCSMSRVGRKVFIP